MEKIRIRFADEQGHIQEAVYQAESLEHLRGVLAERGYFILSSETVPKRISERIKEYLPFGKRVSLGELNEFTKLLRTLLRAGMPLRDSLDVLLDEGQEGELQLALRQVRGDIEEGIAFSRALSRHPLVFPELFVRSVVAGERAGALDEILRRLAQYFENNIALRRKIISAMIYPSILLLVSACAISYMLVAVVPEFADLFQSLNIPLPIYTKLLMDASDFVANWFWVLLGGGFLGVVMLTRYIRTTNGRRQFDELKLTLPILGTLEQKFCLSQFSRTLGTMLQGGIPLVESLNAVLESLENQVIAARLGVLPRELERGAGFAGSLRKIPEASMMMVKMVHVGEESGNLGEMLEHLSDYYDDEIDQLTTTLTSLIEPLMFLGLALLVGGLIIAILLPVLSAASNIG